MKTITIEDVQISIEDTDRYTTDNRSIFEWSITVEGTQYCDADLRSGCGSTLSETQMLETLLSFLSAAAESYRYDGLEGENAHLFPEPVVKWAAVNQDAIGYAQSEVEDELNSELFLEEHYKRMREIAYNWHGGQDSPLYAFASSGICEDKEALLGEIKRCQSVNDSSYKESELELLLEFVEESLERAGTDTWLAPWASEWHGE